MTLVDHKDEILKSVANRFDFENPPCDPVELFDKLKSIMIEKEALGLAAPQIGIPLRVFVFGSPYDPNNISVAFNPMLVDSSGDTILRGEGCLSFPDLYIMIKRQDSIRVRYTTQNNVTNTIKFEGMTSRVFQHELDHLNGITFDKVATKFHLERAKKQAKLVRRRRNGNTQ